MPCAVYCDLILFYCLILDTCSESLMGVFKDNNSSGKRSGALKRSKFVNKLMA
jgi:hypothetical protein